LRREYPSSRYRAGALFATAQIYRDDLGDRDRANEIFEELLRRYPKSDLAGDARRLSPKPPTLAENTTTSRRRYRSLREPASGSRDGIRHWSTPDYTRVAIDLDRNVKFESQRIENPARVFFDLANAKLDRFQIGKIFNVDDGFLKQIRIAQYKADCARSSSTSTAWRLRQLLLVESGPADHRYPRQAGGRYSGRGGGRQGAFGGEAVSVPKPKSNHRTRDG